MSLRVRGRDGQLTFSDKLHDVGVVSVGGINRHEACHAVDVAADHGWITVKAVDVLCVGVHDQSSADAVQLSA